MQGAVVFTKNLFLPYSKQNIMCVLDFDHLKLSQGLYIVKLINGFETLTTKLFILK